MNVCSAQNIEAFIVAATYHPAEGAEHPEAQITMLKVAYFTVLKPAPRL